MISCRNTADASGTDYEGNMIRTAFVLYAREQAIKRETHMISKITAINFKNLKYLEIVEKFS